MPTNYFLTLDRDGDGFACVSARPTDGLNILPQPLTLQGHGISTTGSGIAYQLLHRHTAYGMRYFRIFVDGADTTKTFNMGRTTGGVIATIPVSPSQPYCVALWTRSDFFYSGAVGAGHAFTVRNQSNNFIAQVGITNLPSVWTRHHIPFTSPSDATHINIRFQYGAGGSPQVLAFDIAGFIMVNSLTPPQGFNTGQASDLLERQMITDVLEAEWFNGIQQPFEQMARDNFGQITVFNDQDTFSPELSGVNLGAGAPIWIEAEHNSVLYPLFRGDITYTKTEGGTDRDGRATIFFASGERNLHNANALVPLLVSPDIRTSILAVLNDVGLWRIDPKLEDDPLEFGWLGDAWSFNTSAWQALEQIVRGTGGMMFFNRLGELTYLMHHTTRPAPATLENSWEDITYNYGSIYINRVRVSIRPRVVGSAGSTIWTLEDTLRVPAHESRVFVARLRDSTGRPMGAIDVIAPVAYTDWTAETSGGGDVTPNFTFTIWTDPDTLASGVRGTAIYFEVVNNTGLVDGYIQPGSKIRGTPLMMADRVEYTAQLLQQVLERGSFMQELELPLFTNNAGVELVAHYFLNVWKGGFQEHILNVTVSNRVHFTVGLGKSMGDTLHLIEDKTGHEADYVIIGERHTITMGGHSHQITFTLEPLREE